MQIYDILRATTGEFRKGSDLVIDGQPATDEQRAAYNAALDAKEIPRVGNVVELNFMPPLDAMREDLEKVDMHFFVVGVAKDEAEKYRQEIADWMRSNYTAEELQGEIPYTALGGAIGDQGLAMRLMALGQVLGLWKVLTPEVMGIPEPMASEMAGMGFITIANITLDKTPPSLVS